MSELLPCPFCGNAPILDNDNEVFCFECGRFGDVTLMSPEKWNTRAKPDHATVHEMAKAVSAMMSAWPLYRESGWQVGSRVGGGVVCVNFHEPSVNVAVCTALLHHFGIEEECSG